MERIFTLIGIAGMCVWTLGVEARVSGEEQARLQPDAGEAVVSCSTEVSEKGKACAGELIREAEKRLRENREILRRVGMEEMVEGIVNRARMAAAAGDLSTAYEELTGYPYTSLWIKRGADEFSIRSTHVSYHQAKKLYKAGKYQEALESIRDALLKDVWGTGESKEIGLLRKAYELAAQITGVLKDGKSFIEMTDNVLDDPYLPMDIKVRVTMMRSASLKGIDRKKAEEEANWLIKTPGIKDRYRAYGYMTFYWLEHNKKGSDPDKRFYYLAEEQTCSGGYVNYLYERMAGNRFNLEKYEEALGLYLRAWSLTSAKFNPKGLKEVQGRIAECLVELGHEEKSLEWLAWLAIPPGSRPGCPILGIGKIPEEWDEKWRSLPDKIEGEGADALSAKGTRLYGAGRINEAKPLLERALTSAQWEHQRRNIRIYLRLCEKWGKNLPEQLPYL